MTLKKGKIHDNYFFDNYSFDRLIHAEPIYQAFLL